MNNIAASLTALKNKFSNFAANNQFLFLTLIVIFIGALWRYWGMGSFSGFSITEINLLKTAKELAANHWIISPNQISESIYLYKIAAIGVFSGFNPLSMRLLSATIGIAASIFFFLFVRNWFNKQVALIATLLLATNTTMLILSQAVNPMMMIIALQLAIMYIATIAFRDKNIWLFLLTSVLASIGLFLSPLFIVMGILIFIASIAMIARNPKVFDLYKYHLVMLILPILASLAIYVFLSLESISVLLSYFSVGSIATFYLNVGSNILTLFSGSLFSSNLSVAAEPLLDPFVALSSITGLVYAFFHSGKRKHQFILLWLLFGTVIISLVSKQDVVNIALIMPAIFILSAIMLDYLLTSWVRTFPYNKSARVVMTLIFSIFLFLSIYYNFQKYFYAWQGNPVVQKQYTNTLEINK